MLCPSHRHNMAPLLEPEPTSSGFQPQCCCSSLKTRCFGGNPPRCSTLAALLFVSGSLHGSTLDKVSMPKCQVDLDQLEAQLVPLFKSQHECNQQWKCGHILQQNLCSQQISGTKVLPKLNCHGFLVRVFLNVKNHRSP